MKKIIKALQKGKTIGVTPPVNPRTNKLDFPKWASEDLKNVIFEDMRFLISDSYTFTNEPETLEDEIKKYWVWVAQINKLVAENKQQSYGNTKAFFYIEDRELEAQETISETEKKIECLSKIKDLSQEKKGELLRLLGIDPTYMSLTVITETLYKIANNNPAKDKKQNYKVVLDLLSDADYNYRLLTANLIFDGRIRIENGNYLYGDIFLGNSKDDVVRFMKDKKNKDILNQWKIIYSKQGDVI